MCRQLTREAGHQIPIFRADENAMDQETCHASLFSKYQRCKTLDKNVTAELSDGDK